MSKAITRLEDLQPDPHNANRGTERGRAQLDTSVRRYGAGRSILADKDGVIIAGNKTLETAADLGLPIRAVHTTGGELIVVVRDDLSLATDPAARELAYADNRVAQVDLDFDPSILLADLDAGIDLSALWSDAEIQALLAEAALTPPEPGAGGDEFDATPGAGETRVQPGDLWALGPHRLLCGDSTNPEHVARLMGGQRAGAVVTDVPYEISQHSNGLRRLDYGEWDHAGATAMALAAITLCQDIPTITAFCGDEQLSHMLALWPDRTCRTVAWVKPNPTVLNGEHVFLPALELAAHGRKAGAWFGGRCVRSVWEGTAPREREHANQKPLDLLVWLCELTCPPAGVVYDPFLGSGTTLIAAHRTGRVAYGLEIEPRYCDVVLRRAEAEGIGPIARVLP